MGASKARERGDGASVGNGRQRLIEAALRLAARRGTVESLGLRELAREAGLNPNTFYRHFRDLDELGIAIVEHLGEGIRRVRNEAARAAPDFATFLARSIESSFEFAACEPEAVMLGIREMNLPSAVGSAVRQLRDLLARELLDITRQFNAVPELDDAELLELTCFIINGLFALAVEFIEAEHRSAVLRKAERYATLLVAGAIATRASREKASSSAANGAIALPHVTTPE